ncbi:MAG: hypothetical protein O7A68_09845, partial [Alphaproteobacteria bacterium]|nr:hypothetical protein [Alphaproteobacteria bacterium]
MERTDSLCAIASQWKLGYIALGPAAGAGALIAFGVATARTSGSGGATMVNEKAIADAEVGPAQPKIRTIGTADLIDALTMGLADFKAM